MHLCSFFRFILYSILVQVGMLFILLSSVFDGLTVFNETLSEAAAIP